MKYFPVTLILLFSIQISYGQGTISISGQVRDEESKEALEFCNVSFYNVKDSLITGTATDQRGFYTAELVPANYKQVISYVGNIADTMLLSAYESKFLGVIQLKADLNILEEASVMASSRSSEIDRDVQVVTKEMKEGAFSAKYVLNKLNGVHYDEFNNSIKVDNDERVIILVDGIEKDQEYVKNMAPDRLKKIEVIRDPSGRYGMEGYTAVINIILNHDYMGVEVLLQERGLFDTDAIRREYIPVQNNASATLTYTYNKVSIYGKVGNMANNYNMDQFESKTYANGYSIEKVPAFDDDASIRVKQHSTDYTLGADYFINPRHTLSYEGKATNFPEHLNYVQVYQIVNNIQNGITLSSFESDADIASHSFNTYHSAFYEGRFNENNTLKSNMTYSVFSNTQSIEYTGNGPDQFAQEGADLKQNNNFYTEFDHSFRDKSNILTGYGYTWEQLASEFRSGLQENDFASREWRNKLYLYYSRPLGSKVSVKLGAAGESSLRFLEERTNQYLIFLPHLDLKYDLTPKSNLKLKFRSEGSYPSINQTNPFTTYVDLESVQTGNPDLKPEVTRRLSLQASLLQGAFSIEPYYHFSQNMIITTGMLRPDSIFEYSFHNAGNYRNYGVKTNLSLPIKYKIFIQSSLDLYNSSVEFNQYSNTINDWAMSGQVIYYHHKSKGIAGIGYQKNNNKRILAQGYRQQNVDFWMLLVRRPFFKEQLSVMLLYFAPINLGVDNNQVKFLETDTYQELETTSMDFFKNMVMVEISYRFNKGKVVKKDKEVEYIREKENKSLF